MRIYRGALLMSFLGLIPSGASAGELGGIAVGDTLTSAEIKLADYGAVKVTSMNGVQIVSAGDFSITTCSGHVWAVNRMLSPTFSAFVTTSKLIESQIGRSPEVNITQDDGTHVLRGIEFKWRMPDGTTTTTSYFNDDGNGWADQSVRRTRLCTAAE